MFSWGNHKIIYLFDKQLLNFCLFNFPGKILNDETALKEYKIDEKNFVVVMVTKVSNSFFWVESFINLILFFLVMSGCMCPSLKPVEFHHKQIQVNSKKLTWIDTKYCFTVLVYLGWFLLLLCAEYLYQRKKLLMADFTVYSFMSLCYFFPFIIKRKKAT